MRRLMRGLTALGVAAAGVLTLFTVPAQAATNPYTAASACANDFGGSWVQVSDGRRTIKDWDKTVAQVYLMYNSATGDNCVTTIKRVDIGTRTSVSAHLEVQGAPYRLETGEYKYYSAVKGYARGKCVKYYGSIELDGFYSVGAGRNTWGNCG